MAKTTKPKHIGRNPKVEKEVANYFCTPCNKITKVGLVRMDGSVKTPFVSFVDHQSRKNR